MMPSCAMENCTPVDLAIMKVAAAVPGPPRTSAKVPMNSATSLRGKVTSAITVPTAPAGSVDLTSLGRGVGLRLCSAVPNAVSKKFPLLARAVSIAPALQAWNARGRRAGRNLAVDLLIPPWGAIPSGTCGSASRRRHGQRAIGGLKVARPQPVLLQPQPVVLL